MMVEEEVSVGILAGLRDKGDCLTCKVVDSFGLVFLAIPSCKPLSLIDLLTVISSLQASNITEQFY